MIAIWNKKKIEEENINTWIKHSFWSNIAKMPWIQNSFDSCHFRWLHIEKNKHHEASEYSIWFDWIAFMLASGDQASFIGYFKPYNFKRNHKHNAELWFVKYISKTSTKSAKSILHVEKFGDKFFRKYSILFIICEPKWSTLIMYAGKSSFSTR